MKSYFQCGVEGCEHIQVCKQPEDARRFNTDYGHMIDHYKFKHAPLFGVLRKGTPGVAYNEWWQFGPMPDAIGPSFMAHETDEHIPWSDLKDYVR